MVKTIVSDEVYYSVSSFSSASFSQIYIYIPDFSIYGLEKTNGYVSIMTRNRNFIHKKFHKRVAKILIKKIISGVYSYDRINPMAQQYVPTNFVKFYFCVIYDKYHNNNYNATFDFSKWYENCKSK